jgi:predicted NAD-dependent protein-ADP-ribosyltransferase YbiA (DUF1768 family)
LFYQWLPFIPGWNPGLILIRSAVQRSEIYRGHNLLAFYLKMTAPVFFYSHKGADSRKIFSQFYPAEFVESGITYCCAEQYMMAQKDLIFKDESTRSKILFTTKPIKIKALGRKVNGFDDHIWRQV